MTEVTEKPAKSAKAKVLPKVLTLGAAADKVWAMREEKRILDAQVKKLDDDQCSLICYKDSEVKKKRTKTSLRSI